MGTIIADRQQMRSRKEFFSRPTISMINSNRRSQKSAGLRGPNLAWAGIARTFTGLGRVTAISANDSTRALSVPLTVSTLSSTDQALLN